MKQHRCGRVPGDGLTLCWREWGAHGAAPPLVLLHGLTGCGADWEPVARALAARRRVIALDARGHGASDWAADAAYAGDAHFADVAVALDALGIARCILCGYSMGGGIAILAAGALPERVAGVVVVDAYPDPEMTPGSRHIAEALADLYRRSATHGGGMDGRARFDPAIARRIAEDLDGGEARRLDLWSLWEAICCPTLLVRGGASDVLPAPLAAEMIARQPRARLVTIAGAPHQIPFTHPRALSALIAGFAETV